jgi:hypothetical protein
MGRKGEIKMGRKEACEKIILKKAEKRLLNQIRRNPGLKCMSEEVEMLREYGLVNAQYQMMGGFTVPMENGHYEISDFYEVYAAYRRREFWDYIADKWVDILASAISFVSLIISIIAIMR